MHPEPFLSAQTPPKIDGTLTPASPLLAQFPEAVSLPRFLITHGFLNCQSTSRARNSINALIRDLSHEHGTDPAWAMLLERSGEAMSEPVPLEITSHLAARAEADTNGNHESFLTTLRCQLLFESLNAKLDLMGIELKGNVARANTPEEKEAALQATVNQLSALCDSTHIYQSADQRITSYDIGGILEYPIKGRFDFLTYEPEPAALHTLPSLSQLCDQIAVTKLSLKPCIPLPEFNEPVRMGHQAQFGAKASYLLALTAALPSLETRFNELNLRVAVPDFRLIPSTLRGKELETELRDIFQWIGPDGAMVRSSARFSEDGEVMGAGVYRSYLADGCGSFETFLAAVTSVIASANQPEAIAYRSKHGIAQEEEMGIIIQKYAPGTRDCGNGYVNTMRHGIPQMVDVILEERAIPVFDVDGQNEIETFRSTPVLFSREKVVQSLQIEEYDQENDALIVEFDCNRMGSVRDPFSAAQVACILAEWARRELQVEFTIDECGTVNIVQLRPLPRRWTTPISIAFPEQNHFWSSFAVGTCDEVLDVLGADEENHRKKGVVIMSGSWMSSAMMHEIDQWLPGQGAVVLIERTEQMRGHIETRALERGLTLLYVSTPLEASSRRTVADIQTAYGITRSHLPFEKSMVDGPGVLPPHREFRRVRVVSNGLEGRLYLADDPGRATFDMLR